MSAPYYEERFNINEKITPTPAINSDVFADNVPVETAQIHETPTGGTVAAVGPMNSELITDAIPMYETPIKETAVVETAVSYGSMYDLRADAVPMDEAPVKDVPMTGTAAPVELKDEAIPYQAPVVETVPYKAPVVEPIAPSAAVVPLLTHEASEHFRAHWNEIQGKFVDEPRTAVQQADALVSEVVTQITQMFATEHSSLESQWKQGNDVSTEDLRKALQRYRSFFNRW